ncbi:uncharacterized protein LOC133913589 isoform X2 [Phragmites australis]|uniref:uncharacterized protein LOC133913589 isoform X2 n=1 Tax=Phragmites australis TaxID=29695 RepID=UPI002D770433|nr:uncharacterized protein LOC133913589 isoform X2 [Phragmites australis]
MSSGASMDAISLDEWELLPDHKSSSFMEECSNGHGTVGDEEAKKPPLPTSEDAYAHDPATEFKDIGVVQTKSKRGDILTEVTEILISGAEEEELIKSPAGAKKVDQDEVLVEATPDDHCAQEQEDIKKIGFSVGNLRVNGVGALCSFGVAAATFCIFLFGGNQQQQQKRQNHKIQLQMYADDERIQQVVQQASRLNQTMSSVMGGAPSTRASISFGGYYHGF